MNECWRGMIQSSFLSITEQQQQEGDGEEPQEQDLPAATVSTSRCTKRSKKVCLSLEIERGGGVDYWYRATVGKSVCSLSRERQFGG